MRLRNASPSLGLLLAGCVGQPPAPPQDTEAPPSTGTGGPTDPTDPTGPAPPMDTTLGSVGDTAAETSSGGPDPDEGSTSTSGSSGMPGSDDTSTGRPADGPLLTISDGLTYDFGDVPLDDTNVHAFTVTNEGDLEATGLTGLPLVAPFDYTNGAFPGAAGTCGQALAGGDSCLVEVAFTPEDLGLVEDTLAIAYDGAADATRPLAGGGMGQSPNLLVNPGGEDSGEPPPGWTDAGVGSWIAGIVPMETVPVEGGGYLYADTGPDNQGFTLLQDVDVTQWATTIDADAMRFSFDGWARALTIGNDEYRLRVQYQDAGGVVLDTYTVGWTTSSDWEHHEDLRLAPADTRTVQVELGCLKPIGQWCNAYFDALDLHAVYP